LPVGKPASSAGCENHSDLARALAIDAIDFEMYHVKEL